jgi:RecA-family ATPase
VRHLPAGSSGVARRLRVLELATFWPTIEESDDVSDWFEAGGTVEQLWGFVDQLADWTPSATNGGEIPPTSAPAAGGVAHSPLVFANISVWASREPPPREWAVPDRFPLRNVGLLSGEGAAGKSILMMQLAAAIVLGKDWLFALPEQGPVIYVNAEDDDDELHRRLLAIAQHYGASLTELTRHLHILSLAGQDAVLGHPDRTGQIKPTSLFVRLKEAACDIRPRMIGLDTAADIFGGNEIDRSQVRQFLGLQRQIAIGANAGVILCTHPSLTGISSGSGLSGSTAWHNSVRARMYLRPAVTEEGEEPDPELRQLEFRKNNYGPLAERILIRWKNGVYVPEPGTGSLERAAADAKTDNIFLEVLSRFTREGRAAIDTKGHGYAPVLFAQEPEAKAAKKKKAELADAMRRLFASNRIHREKYRSGGHDHWRLAVGAKP